MRFISYNSWDEIFKAPFGALNIKDESIINVVTNKDTDVYNISLVILGENEDLSNYEHKRISLKEIQNIDNEKTFTCKVDCFENPGIYFYYFEVEGNRHGYTEKVFYGKNYSDGNICEYGYENLNKYQITVSDDLKVPSWYKEGILYHIFVDRFNNGNRNDKPLNPKKNTFMYANWDDDPMYIKDSNGDIIRWDFYGGNIKGIINKLGYLKKLGVTIIYLSPIFEAASNHKYDTGDYKKIDAMFGDEETFKELIEKAKEKGISIILDGVFNHTGADSKYFNRFGNYDSIGAYQSKESEYASWYNFEYFPNEYESWWGIKALPNVNELDSNYMNYIMRDEDSVIKKWTSMGVKGWRLDVVDELPLPFVKELRKELKDVEKDAILVGEVWEDASNKISYNKRRNYFSGDKLDSVMGYPFRKNMVDFLKYECNSVELVNNYMNIKENYPKESFKSNLNLIGTHDVKRIKTELNLDKELVKLAVITQMTFEGIPYIYYGDEAGLEGGTDPDNRRTYPWKNEDEEMIEFYKNAISTRKKYTALASGDTKFIYTNNDNVFGFMRISNDDNGDDVLILINRASEEQNISVNIDADMLEEIPLKYVPKKYGEVIQKDQDGLFNSGMFNINISEKSFKILSLRKNLE
ncbi:MAG: glycoside hydrolase family 13 protein [Peptostreptococcaceae bacterium]